MTCLTTLALWAKNIPLVMFELFKWYLPHFCHWRTFLLKVYIFQHFLTIFLSGKLFHLTKHNNLCLSYFVRCFCKGKWSHRWPIPPLPCSFLLFPFVLPTTPPIWGHLYGQIKQTKSANCQNDVTKVMNIDPKLCSDQ